MRTRPSASLMPKAGPLAAAVAWVEAQALFIAAVGAVAAFSLARLPEHLNQDGWLALVGGRYVAGHGIPQHDVLNVMTHGARWIDQQWLAQLLSYELHQAGGLALYTLVYVALAVLSLALAIAAAGTLGGTERHVLWVLPLAGFLYFAGSFQIRTQGFAYPLFVTTLWLLAKEVKEPGPRRVYLVFPLLILWANLHGSVTVGVGLAMIYGVTLLAADLRSDGWRTPLTSIRRRAVVFTIGPALCLFATPYGVGIIGYYRSTLLNPSFSKVVTEWQPVTTILVLAVPFFLAAFATVWLLGRSGARTPVFNQLALILLAAAAVFAVRNITWFGLAVAVLMPATISRMAPIGRVAKRRKSLNLALAGLSLTILAGAVISVAVRPQTWFERGYDQRVLSAIGSIVANQPHAHIFADVHYADWLLWHDPALAGTLAYDTRFELLSQKQILAIANLGQVAAPQERDILAGYRVLVLDARGAATKLLLARPGTQVALRSSHTVVALSSGQ